MFRLISGAGFCGALLSSLAPCHSIGGRRGKARHGGTKGQRGGLQTSEWFLYLVERDAQGVGWTGSGHSPLSACSPLTPTWWPRPAPNREDSCFAGTNCRGREKVTLSSEKLVQRVEEKGDQTYVSGVSRDREVTRPVSRAL